MELSIAYLFTEALVETKEAKYEMRVISKSIKSFPW